MAKKQKIIIGNWKMNPISREKALSLFSGIVSRAAKYKNAKTVICPPYVYLESGSRILSKASKTSVSLGAQDLFYESEGAFTGEISAGLLSQFNTEYVLIGHSERRKLGETDEVVNKKVHAALKLKLKPIICIGESKRDEDGQYLTFIREQVTKALIGVPKLGLSKIIIAYEPIWAIGAASAMSAHDVHEMMIFIKKCLVELYKIRMISALIIYGGSVDSLNAGDILTNGESDGLLVGRQSLDANAFGEILRSTHGM